MSTQVQEWVGERRKALANQCSDCPGGSENIWGLALSGGGIRSATFCFGLLRALAGSGALTRFDVMSTVSGGGYIGGALGKLFHHANDAADTMRVHRSLRENGRDWFTWWLRANGRYLIPRGFKDTLFALSLYVQNLVGVHAEIGVIALLLGIVLATVNISVWSVLAAISWGETLTTTLPYGFRWLPTLWLSFVPMGIVGIVLMSSYWTLPEPSTEDATSIRSHSYVGAALIAVVALVHVRPPLARLDAVAWLWLVAFMVTAGWGIAVPVGRLALAKARRRFADSPAANREAMAREEARHLLTQWLGGLGRLAAAVVVAGMLDRLAWQVAFEFDAVQWLATALLMATALLRTLLPRLAPTSVTGKSRLGAGIAAAADLAGYALFFCVVLSWVAALYKLLFAGTETTFLFLSWRAAAVASVVFVLIAGYAWITRYDFGFLNLSSLHNFYRARITRSYLGAANGERFVAKGNSLLRCLDPVPEEPPGGRQIAEVTSVHAGDDVPMADYWPHRHGGPVHLINACINETRDPRGGLFNQDRRGLPMLIGPGAWMRVGMQPWRKAVHAGALTLGRWMAISGAAVAPGLGQMTRGGVSALSVLAGLRLGYWWEPWHLVDGDETTKDPTAHAHRRGNKSQGLVDELLGNFATSVSRAWYLSDGGHYENTGALALLAEQANLIVLADCGADPDYAFADLERLVRIARIDLKTEIEFLRPRTESTDPRLGVFGSLDQLASAQSLACLALARVRYAADHPVGYLVLVKPNLSAGMTADLVNFKRDNPTFPQETTTDQFFGEAQWESYYKLGRILGGHLTPALLGDLPTIAQECFEDDLCISPHRNGQPSETAPPDGLADARAGTGLGRLPARIAGSAIVASVGLGAAATVGISVWQATDSLRANYASRRATEEAAVKELADHFGRWNEQQPDTLGPLAAAVLRVTGPCRDDGDNSRVRRSLLAQCILKDVRRACGLPAARELPACRELSAPQPLDCLRPTKPHYWGLNLVDPAEPDTERCAGQADIAWVPNAPDKPLATAPSAQTSSLPEARPVSGEDSPCKGKTVYVQIFGGEQRAAMRSYRDAWRALGASVPPIEDVLASARRVGRDPPRADGTSTRIIYHDSESKACAEAILQSVKRSDGSADWSKPQPLPARFRPIPGTIEVWVKPPNS